MAAFAEANVATLRGYMDVITRTTFHLQGRNQCGGESAKHFASVSKPSAAGFGCRTEDLGVTREQGRMDLFTEGHARRWRGAAADTAS